MSDSPARLRRKLAVNVAAAVPAAAESDGGERPRKKPGRKPATSVLCQVAGCGKELLRPGATAGRDYYSRYRICREHCIAPQLTIDGKVQRFCQQHGRFHDLDKFEPHRRSCIAALSHHRQRRRTFGGKQGGRGQPGASRQPPQQPEQQGQQQQGQRAAAMAVHTVPPNTPSQSFGCAACDSEAATPATPVCLVGEKSGRWQGACFAPQLAAAPPAPAPPTLSAAAAAKASPGRPAAGGSSLALQPALQPACSGDARSEAVAAARELELLFEEQPQLSSSTGEEMAERWLTEVLFEGAPADVKSPYEALLESDVW